MKRAWLWASWPLALLAAAFAASVGHAEAPAGRYAISGENVRDTVTGLVWQRTVSQTRRNFAQAQAYCATLLPAGAWRVPSIKELETLVDFATPAPAIDHTAFPGTPSAYFWSSSEPATSSPIFGYVTEFTNGVANLGDRNVALYVRCVQR